MSTYVKAFYKTGAYVGKIHSEDHRGTVVEILSVIKHPKQGDLHNPNSIDVPLFHERKALANHEKAIIPTSMIKPHNAGFLEYKDSLIKAVTEYEESLLESSTAFSDACYNALQEVKKEYQLMYRISFP
ncbi:kinase-associated lipoprotein B [Mangrovibacillus cuniculi]|uniref:Kinase n=1 Tax=Mangrovibacillus cuniculi TaxID=2593652 RepID=A0A7S8CCA4_9BACI|nr:kinase-associated lipoprotein B [Mangrovibacillus cuniculi]QPC47340.1 kinase [Mangrovibacillus cuniculi]